MAEPSGVSVVEPASQIDDLLYATGVMNQLAHLSSVIDQELAVLSRSRLFSDAEIEGIRKELESLREHAIYELMVDTIPAQFTPQELSLLSHWATQPAVHELLAWERDLASAGTRDELRQYRERMTVHAPAPARVTLMQSLDKARRQSALEVIIKVGIRKHILSSVSRLKTGQRLDESVLTRELTPYEKRLSEQLEQQATQTYLFVFRKTPTSGIEHAVNAYRHPLFTRFMDAASAVMHNALLDARHQR